MMVVFGLDICSEIKATMKNKMAQLKKPHSSKSKQKMYTEDDSSSDDNNNDDDNFEDISAAIITTSSSNNSINSKERTSNFYLTSSATVLADRNSTINVSVSEKRRIKSDEEDVAYNYKKYVT